MNGPLDKLKAIKTERRQQRKGDKTIFDHLEKKTLVKIIPWLKYFCKLHHEHLVTYMSQIIFIIARIIWWKSHPLSNHPIICFNFYILKPNGLFKEKTFAYSLVFPVTQWADFPRGSCLLNCLDVKCVHSFNNLDRNHLLKKLLLDWLSISGSVVLSNLPFHCALTNPMCSYKPHLRKNI